jgi:hypothetical protein
MIEKLGYFLMKVITFIQSSYIIWFGYIFLFIIFYKIFSKRMKIKRFVNIKSILFTSLILIFITLISISVIDNILSHQPF